MEAEKVFLPYVFMPDAIAIAPESMAQGEKEVDIAPDYQARTLRLHDFAQNGPLRMTIRGDLRDGRRTLDGVIPSTEHGAPPVAAHVTFESSDTFIRWGSEATLDPETGIFTMDVELDPSLMGSRLCVQPFVVRTSGQDSDPTFAQQEGARVLSGMPWTFYFDDVPSREGPGLKPRWESFSTSSDPILKGNPRLLFHLNTEGDEPILYLNSDYSDIKVVLDSEGTRGRKASLRDAMFAMISSHVWMGLTLAAIEYADEDGESTLPWVRNSIQHIGSLVYPDLGHEEASRKLVRTLRDDSSSSATLAEIRIAVLQQTQMGEKFEDLLVEVGE